MLAQVGIQLGLEIPVFSELHLKVSIEDHLGVVPREAPFLIWEDPQNIEWSEEEREFLSESRGRRQLLGEMPPGVHMRIEGGGGSRHLLILWPYHLEPVAENFPLPIPDHYAEICLRGISAMIPGLAAYVERMPQAAHRRRLLHQDAGEPTARGAAAGRGRIRPRRVVGLRVDGVVRRQRNWWRGTSSGARCPTTRRRFIRGGMRIRSTSQRLRDGWIRTQL